MEDFVREFAFTEKLEMEKMLKNQIVIWISERGASKNRVSNKRLWIVKV